MNLPTNTLPDTTSKERRMVRVEQQVIQLQRRLLELAKAQSVATATLNQLLSVVLKK